MRDNNRLNLSWLCETACVSRSGYYSYLQNEAKRQEREEADRKDFLLIVEAYQFRGYVLFRTLYAEKRSRNRQIHCPTYLMEKDEKLVRIHEAFSIAEHSLTAKDAAVYTDASGCFTNEGIRDIMTASL